MALKGLAKRITKKQAVVFIIALLVAAPLVYHYGKRDPYTNPRKSDLPRLLRGLEARLNVLQSPYDRFHGFVRKCDSVLGTKMSSPLYNIFLETKEEEEKRVSQSIRAIGILYGKDVEDIVETHEKNPDAMGQQSLERDFVVFATLSQRIKCDRMIWDFVEVFEQKDQQLSERAYFMLSFMYPSARPMNPEWENDPLVQEFAANLKKLSHLSPDDVWRREGPGLRWNELRFELKRL